MEDALWICDPHADSNNNRTGKSKTIILQVTDSALSDYGIPPGRFLVGEITDAIHPDRLMACFIDGVAIAGRIRPVDAESFEIGDMTIRFEETSFFVLLFEIPQKATQF